MRAKHIRKASTRHNMGPRMVQYNHPGRELASAQGLFWCPDMLNNVNRTADITRLPDKRSKAWRVTEALMHETDGGTLITQWVCSLKGKTANKTLSQKRGLSSPSLG